MGVIYQLTFFVALGLIAIVVAIFVLAVSLLGRAIEASARIEEEKLIDRKLKTKEIIETVEKDIKLAEKTGEVSTDLVQRLKKLEKIDRNFKKELNKIRKAPGSLTARGGVFYPGSFLVAALILSGTAWYFSLDTNINTMIPNSFWIASVIVIIYATYRTCKSLKVIQDVAVTSEEEWTKKIVEAFKIAQKEIEEERKPKIELGFGKITFPLEERVDSEITLTIEAKVVEGPSADDVQLHIGLPKVFKLPKESASDTYELPSFLEDKDYIFTRFQIGTMVQGLISTKKLIIQSPSEPGEHTLFCNLVSRGCAPKRISNKIVLK